VWEGEDAAHATHEDVLAMKVAGMLANGMGGYHWDALPLAVAFFGVGDMEDLLERLLVLKLHRPRAPGINQD
jgi:hypothetical protein